MVCGINDTTHVLISVTYFILQQSIVQRLTEMRATNLSTAYRQFNNSSLQCKRRVACFCSYDVMMPIDSASYHNYSAESGFKFPHHAQRYLTDLQITERDRSVSTDVFSFLKTNFDGEIYL